MLEGTFILHLWAKLILFWSSPNGHAPWNSKNLSSSSSSVLPRLQVGIVTFAELVAYQPTLVRSSGFYPLYLDHGKEVPWAKSGRSVSNLRSLGERLPKLSVAQWYQFVSSIAYYFGAASSPLIFHLRRDSSLDRRNRFCRRKTTFPPERPIAIDDRAISLNRCFSAISASDCSRWSDDSWTLWSFHSEQDRRPGPICRRWLKLNHDPVSRLLSERNNEQTVNEVEFFSRYRENVPSQQSTFANKKNRLRNNMLRTLLIP